MPASTRATRFGRFQFVLGREIGVTFYGDESLLAPGEPGTLRIIAFKSTYVDLPILEYRPYRAFGYPAVPALYIAGATLILLVLFAYRTSTTWPGLVIVLLGVPVYFAWRSKD